MTSHTTTDHMMLLIAILCCSYVVEVHPAAVAEYQYFFSSHGMNDRQEPGDTSEAITTASITRDSISSPRTCLAKTFSRRVGPIYVAFQLPSSEAGTQYDFQGGRAYRHLGDTCYSVGWSDHSFVCDAESQDFLQLSGDWPVPASIPQDCANGGGSMVNQTQANLMVSNNMPLSCPGMSVDIHNNPINIRFSLPEGRDAHNNLFISGGSVGRKVSGLCFQIEWSNLVFTCDPSTYTWNLTSGMWRTPQEPWGCADWVEGVQQASNAEQEFLQVGDTTGSSPCQEAVVERTSGPLKVAFVLPGDHMGGTTVAYESGQIVRWFNSTCYNLLWTNHIYMCDVYTAKWILESGDFVGSPNEPRYCNGLNGGYTLNGDQPNLLVVDLTQTDAPTSAPFKIVRPILTESPSFSPSFSPHTIQRPIETDVPNAPTTINFPERPTSAPFKVVKPIETFDPYPPFSSSPVGAIYAISSPPTERPASLPVAITNAPTTVHTTENSTPPAATNPPSSRPASTAPSTATGTPLQGTSYPSSAPLNSDAVPYYCGCPACTQVVWTNDAESFTCGERIEYIVISLGGDLLEACRLVAGREFPTSCGPYCDPDTCQSIVGDNGIAVDSNSDGTDQPTMIVLQTTLAPSHQSTGVPTTSVQESAITSSGFPDNDRLPAQSDTEGSPVLNSKPGISAGLASSSAQPMNSNADAVTLVPSQAPTISTMDFGEQNLNLRITSGAYSLHACQFGCSINLVLVLSFCWLVIDL